MHLSQTEELKKLLTEAAVCERLDTVRRQEAAQLAEAESVEWSKLWPIYEELRKLSDGRGPWLHLACQRSTLTLPSPKARVKSPELLARLARLQKEQETRDYNKLVHDITKQERDAKDAAENSLITYKEQLGFGVHVLVMMGTLYAVGHVAGMSLSKNRAYHAAGGLLGLVVALFLEMFLFVIRTSYTPPASVRPRPRGPQPAHLQHPVASDSSSEGASQLSKKVQ